MPRRKGYRSEGKAQVEVLLPEIGAALAEGRSLKGFHEANRHRLSISYVQLTRIIRALDKTAYKPEIKLSLAQAYTPQRDEAKPTPKTLFIGLDDKPEPTFVWDPVACYSKKYD